MNFITKSRASYLSKPVLIFIILQKQSVRYYMSRHGNKDKDDDVFLPHVTDLWIQEAMDSFACLIKGNRMVVKLLRNEFVVLLLFKCG